MSQASQILGLVALRFRISNFETLWTASSLCLSERSSQIVMNWLVLARSRRLSVGNLKRLILREISVDFLFAWFLVKPSEIGGMSDLG